MKIDLMQDFMKSAVLVVAGTVSGLASADALVTLQVTRLYQCWTPKLSVQRFPCAVPFACWWLSLWVWAWSLLGFVARRLWSALPVQFLF